MRHNQIIPTRMKLQKTSFHTPCPPGPGTKLLHSDRVRLSVGMVDGQGWAAVSITADGPGPAHLSPASSTSDGVRALIWATKTGGLSRCSTGGRASPGLALEALLRGTPPASNVCIEFSVPAAPWLAFF